MVCLVHRLEILGDSWSIEISRRQHAGHCPYTLEMEGKASLMNPNEVYCGCQPNADYTLS